MKSLRKSLFLLTLILPLTACGGEDSNSGNSGGGGNGPNTLPKHTAARSLAFPGADGGASAITGGAGGSVYIVTSLADDYSTGTLRSALSSDNRTIVFAVGGQINLTSQLKINKSNITIAGQSAPGDGITIAGFPVTISGKNIIMRYLRIRMGDLQKDKYTISSDEVSPDPDALGAKDASNILIDHCSISWCVDECASFSRVENFTMQYCIISESMRESFHPKGKHGYGGIWGGKNASYHHNLLAHHDSRNPRFDHQYVGHTCLGPIDYINNVVYNWGSNSTYGGETASESDLFHINMIGNYYKPGPSTESGCKNRLMQLTSICENCNKHVGKTGQSTAYPAKIYIEGNMVNGSAATWSSNIQQESKETRNTKSMAMLSSRWTEGLTALNFTESADKAYESVLNFAGASLKRDAVDKRVINDVKNGTGSLINSQEDVGGFPTLSGGTAITDTDKDGMPDDWEIAQMAALGVTGKAVSEFSPSAYNLTAQYTNLEVYLNSLVTGTFPAGAKATEIK